MEGGGRKEPLVMEPVCALSDARIQQDDHEDDVRKELGRSSTLFAQLRGSWRS